MRSGKIITVSPDIRTRVEARAAECLDIASKHFHRSYQHVSISYTLRGSTAGVYTVGTNKIKINSVLLVENVDDFITRTVAHEVAHYVNHINGNDDPQGSSADALARHLNNGWSLRRQKRDVHGPKWQAIMRLFGAPTSRTHSYDLTNAAIKRKKHKVKCSGCGTVIEVSAQRYNKIRRGVKYNLRGHIGCGHLIDFYAKSEIDPKDQWVDFPTTTAPRAAAKPVSKPTRSHTGTKLDLCKDLYKKYIGISRGEMIDEFVRQAGCTPAGAATYYATCAKLYGR